MEIIHLSMTYFLYSWLMVITELMKLKTLISTEIQSKSELVKTCYKKYK